MLQTFNFFVFIIEVHGNKIMRVCAPPPEMKIIDDAGIFKNFGEPIDFVGAAFMDRIPERSH